VENGRLIGKRIANQRMGRSWYPKPRKVFFGPLHGGFGMNGMKSPNHGSALEILAKIMMVVIFLQWLQRLLLGMGSEPERHCSPHFLSHQAAQMHHG
jgi:hypothetical protein